MITTQFQVTDAIVTMGKWAFQQIPDGDRCSSGLGAQCPMLREVWGASINNPQKQPYVCHCDAFNKLLRNDHFGAIKGDFCPKYKIK